MQREVSRASASDLAASSFMTALIVLAVFYLHRFDPVDYIYLIAEDYYGEYATSASFGLAGALLVALALRGGPGWQRWIRALIGLVALLIAAEELSWGQRIFGLATPEMILEANMQKELNLHNLGAAWEVNKRLHWIAAYLILAWLAFGAALSIWAPTLKHRLSRIGMPFIPLGLAPLFLLSPLFVLSWHLVKGDEVSELALGLAVVAWAAHLFVGEVRIGPPAPWRGAGAMVGAFLLVAAASAALTHQFPGPLGWRLNMVASRGYPGLGLYHQAQMVFDYILARPEYIRPDTRSNYEAMRQLAARKGRGE